MEKPSTWWDSKPRPFDHEGRELPLSSNHCPNCKQLLKSWELDCAEFRPKTTCKSNFLVFSNLSFSASCCSSRGILIKWPSRSDKILQAEKKLKSAFYFKGLIIIFNSKRDFLFLLMQCNALSFKASRICWDYKMSFRPFVWWCHSLSVSSMVSVT